MKKQNGSAVDRFMAACAHMRENDGVEFRNINEWLSILLAPGALPTTEVTTRAKIAGFKKSDLRLARKELGVRTINVGGGVWLWELPVMQGEAGRVHKDQSLVHH